MTHPEKRDDLRRCFEQDGWDYEQPPLTGYLHEGYVQLLSGSHRWSAARLADILVPVIVYTRAEVEAAWGDLERWKELMDGI